MLLRDFCFLFSQRDRLRFLFLIILLLGCSFMELATLGAVPLFVAALIGQADALRTVSKLPFCHDVCNFGIENIAIYGGILLGVLFLLRTLYFMLCANVQERIMRNRMIAITSRLFRSYMFAPYAVSRTYNSSTVIEHACTECQELILHLLDPALNFIRNSIMVLSVMLLLVCFDPVASVTSFVALGSIGCLFMLLANRRIKALGQEASDYRTQSAKIMSDGMGIRREASLAAVRKHYTSLFHGSLERQTEPLRISNTIQRCVWPSMELITVMVLLATMCLLLAGGRKMESVVPTLSLLAVCLARMKGCVTELMIHFSYIRYNTPLLGRISAEIRKFEEGSQYEVNADENAVSLVFQDRISIRDLEFSYPDGDKPVLSRVSFDIARGSSVAFVGPTGAGKSTMADLLLGLFRPSSGNILVDGKDIFENLGPWRRNIGFVPQDIFLMDCSIRDNIAFGVDEKDIDDQALANAIHAASLDEFIASLPAGMDTIVGERGTRLSGGQRQRIGIARALYRNPDILVFDEATSALDNDTEKAVMNAIETLRGSHTLIIVAHRLSTVKGCNEIFRFDNAGVTRFDSLEEMTRG